MITRLGVDGYGVKRAGSFAGKEIDTIVLSLPTAIATGANTATGTVTTDDDSGTLYFWATINATEDAADIIASGESQDVTASGLQNVSFTGLNAQTEYYAHYVQTRQATESNVVNGDAFATAIDQIDIITTEPRQKVPQPTAHAFGMLRAGDAKVSGRGSANWKRHNEDALLLLAA